MPRNGSGQYSLPQSPFSPNTTISSSAVNSDFSDIASALTGSVAADGQTPITGTFKFGDGSSSNPIITFTTNLEDGFYHPSAGVIGVALNGVEGFTFQAPSSATGAGILGPSNAIIMPIGVIWDFAGSSAPAGWFLCYGQTLATATYPELYAVIGTTFGGTSSNFALPDLRGRTAVGQDNMGGSAANRITNAVCGIVGTTLGAAGGDQNVGAHTHTASSVVTDPGHTHTLTGSSAGINVAGGGSNFLQAGGSETTSNNTTGISVATTVNSGGTGVGENVQPSIILNKIIFAGHP